MTRLVTGALTAGLATILLFSTTSPAQAMDEAAFKAEETRLFKMNVGPVTPPRQIEAGYEALLDTPDLTPEQRASALATRASFRGSDGQNKVGQLADLDMLVEQYPDIRNAELFKERRAYAWVQTWYMTDRLLKDMTGDKAFGELWGLGYWDDAVATLLNRRKPATLDGLHISWLQREGYIEAGSGGKGGGGGGVGRSTVVNDQKNVFEIKGYGGASPQPRQGEGLEATLQALQAEAAQYKTD